MRALAWLLLMGLAISAQEPAKGYAGDRAGLDAWLAKETHKLADGFLKSKWTEEARALLEVIRQKSEAEAPALEALLSKCGAPPKDPADKPWPDGARSKVKDLGKEAARRHWALTKKWASQEAEACRWLHTEGEILDELLEYLQAHRILNEFRHQAGVPRAKFSWKLSVPCVWHCKYVAKFPDDEDESPSKEGYSKEGSQSGANSYLSTEVSLPDLLISALSDAKISYYTYNPNLISYGLGTSNNPLKTSSIDIKTHIEFGASAIEHVTLPPENSTIVTTRGLTSTHALASGAFPQDCGPTIAIHFYNSEKYSPLGEAQLKYNNDTLTLFTGDKGNSVFKDRALNLSYVAIPSKALPGPGTYAAQFTSSKGEIYKITFYVKI